MMNETRYCIGESSQYQAMQVVKHPPLHPQQTRWGNYDDLLRSGIYYSVEDATAICLEAKSRMGVEFVVLVLAEPEDKQ